MIMPSWKPSAAALRGAAAVAIAAAADGGKHMRPAAGQSGI